MTEQQNIRVGVGCLVFKDGKLLLGKRIDDSHGDGEWTCGGGHVDFMENLAETAKREIEEEWGIKISEPEFLCVTNLKKYSGKHYIDIGFRASWVSGDPNPKAEGEFSAFGWYELDTLPAPLFGVVPNYIAAMQMHQPYFETSK